MIRKFAAVFGRRVKITALIVTGLIMTTLAGTTTVLAQQPETQPSSQPQPAQETPGQQTQAPADKQQSRSQEASPEETTSSRKPKPKEFEKWNFHVGGGASLMGGTTNTFVRGGGGVAAAGVARNYSPYFGLRLDFQFDNLPLRDSALLLAQAPGGTSHAYSLMFDPIINLPVNDRWSGYIVFGPAYIHRSGKLDSSTALPGSACNEFFTWWGHCYSNSLPVNGKFLNASQNEFGYNVGVGVARKVHSQVEVYAEVRMVHGAANGLSTDVRPITIGVRW